MWNINFDETYFGARDWTEDRIRTNTSSLTFLIFLLHSLEDSPARLGTAKSEQLLLYIRCLHLLSSALRLAKDELEEGKLRPSTAVKQVGVWVLAPHFHNLSFRFRFNLKYI